MNDILLTGLPRSGTTLLCACINRLANCLALAEPISPPTHGNVEEALKSISAFLAATRERALRDQRVATKSTALGLNTENWFETPTPSGRLRVSSEKINDLSLDKALTPNFKLIVKQPGFFTALAERLTDYYPVYAMVRHPLAVLASWQTVDMPVNRGRWPVAEAFSQHLRSGLEALAAPLDRQIFILKWCFEVYQRLPQERVIRYEDLLTSPTETLRKVAGTASAINYPFHFEHLISRYPSVNLPALAQVLLPLASEFEDLYPCFADSLRLYFDWTWHLHLAVDHWTMDESNISQHVTLYRSGLNGGVLGRHALIAFGGISLGLGMPVFEFFRTLASLGIDVLFIRDPKQGWYQRPIPGLGNRATEIAENIMALTGALFPNRKIIAVGNSMGGYAALMFGCLCGFEKVLAFCPQSFISPELRSKHGDLRWQDQVSSIENQEIGDVKELLNHSESLETHIYVGKDQPLDLLHAQRLSGVKNVNVHLIDNCGHNVSQYLRDSGQLNKIIDRLLA